MDIVGFDRMVYDRIEKDIQGIADRIGYKGELFFIPVAAKTGANIVHASTDMPWYTGKVLLEYLENLPVHKKDEELSARFPVQFVIRPHSEQYHDFRAYAGKLVSGILTQGQEVTVLPSMRTSRIKKLYRSQNQIDFARAGESISLELEEDIDVSRGDMIVPGDAVLKPATQFTATICWMEEQQLAHAGTYLLQHGVNVVRAKITSLISKMDMETMEVNHEVSGFKLNDIGTVGIKTARPVYADLYRTNPDNGAFILLDEFTNNTVAVGFIESF